MTKDELYKKLEDITAGLDPESVSDEKIKAVLAIVDAARLAMDYGFEEDLETYMRAAVLMNMTCHVQEPVN